jgi:putative NADH-flavin reductase
MKHSKIALLGATSKTGLEFIKLASTDANIEVFAFVRNVEKLKQGLKEIPANLQIVPFDVRGDQAWSKQLAECDVWVSIVGIAGLMAARKPNKLYERTAQLLTQQAALHNPKRVIVVTSGGVVESESEPWILKKVLKPYFLNPMYDDMRVMEKMISTSSMNYTVVRPPYLTNGKMVGSYRVIMDEWFTDDKVLSRKDLAHFLFAQSSELNENFNRRFVGVSY